MQMTVKDLFKEVKAGFDTELDTTTFPSNTKMSYSQEDANDYPGHDPLRAFYERINGQLGNTESIHIVNNQGAFYAQIIHPQYMVVFDSRAGFLDRARIALPVTPTGPLTAEYEGPRKQPVGMIAALAGRVHVEPAYSYQPIGTIKKEETIKREMSEAHEKVDSLLRTRAAVIMVYGDLGTSSAFVEVFEKDKDFISLEPREIARELLELRNSVRQTGYAS